MSLNIGTEIPVGLFNKRAALLAMQGAGKTYTAGVMEEEMLDYILENPESAKLIIIDPVGAHWGIREKFPIHIIGGEHGDIEIDYQSGKLFAQVVNTGNLSMLFDLSTLKEEEALQFTTDFLNELFQITRTPTHIILEEADMFAPQRNISKLHKFSNAAVDSIVRRGRGRGLGMTMITQRPAVLNKNVLTQVDMSLIMNITGQTDLNTIEEYLDNSGKSKKEINDLIEKIMKFEKGQALLFSPSWLKKIDTVNIRKRISFHAGAEPELGLPDPSKSIHLIKMNISPVVDFLNGNVNKISVNVNDAPRSNVWSEGGDSPSKDEFERYELLAYHAGSKGKLAKTIGIITVGVLFLWSILAIAF